MENFFSHPFLFGEGFLNSIHLYIGRWFDWFMAVVTLSGEKYFYVFLLILIYWCGDRKRSIQVTFLLLGAALLNEGAKLFFHNPRPDALYLAEGIARLNRQFFPKDSFGFPSGHTQLSFTFWTALGIFSRKKSILIPGLLLSALIAYSRLYLGVHFFGDVIGGFVLFLVFFPLSLWCLHFFSKNSDRIPQIPLMLLIIIIPAAITPFVPGSSMPQLLGISSGYVFGLMIARRHIQFHPAKGVMANILKVVIGFSAGLLIYEGLSLLLPDMKVLSFLVTWITGFWLSAGAPFLFEKIGMKKEI